MLTWASLESKHLTCRVFVVLCATPDQTICSISAESESLTDWSLFKKNSVPEEGGTGETYSRYGSCSNICWSHGLYVSTNCLKEFGGNFS